MSNEEKNRLFEEWYQSYIKSHNVGNPAKSKEFARWAFWAGVEAHQHSVQPTPPTACEFCGHVPNKSNGGLRNLAKSAGG